MPVHFLYPASVTWYFSQYRTLTQKSNIRRSIEADKNSKHVKMLSKFAIQQVPQQKPKEKRIKNKQCVKYSEDELAEKRRKVQKHNTIAADKSTGNQLVLYLRQIQANENYWQYEPAVLDEHLSKFWFAARTNKVNEQGEQKKYKIQSLRSLRYGIN